MSLRSATDLFSEWADVGRDEGMERGHSASVEVMLKELLEGWNRPFRAMDIGCGNGWVVRRLSAHALCSHASGVDGAPSMIAKARTIDPDGDYIEAMLPEWTPRAPYDLVHTMECLYYLEDPLGFLQTLHDEWMLPGGRLVIGVDHYTENPASHDWGPSLN
ncbi:MAG: class I SAM-dependent methyltransferase, partial [Candidatus Thermoplasmatota archaeon]|nr:class I SAM-dependent methyltransferase [Candidatus Thermoplasmatota archaeon]